MLLTLMKLRITGSVPLTALFILFDFIIHNPTHQETDRNIALLGIVVGYFSRLEFGSGGHFPTSFLFDFVQIVREYIQTKGKSMAMSSAQPLPAHESLVISAQYPENGDPTISSNIVSILKYCCLMQGQI